MRTSEPGPGVPAARRRPAVPLAAAPAVALAGGLGTWLAFPATGWWPLAVPGLAALVVAVAGRRPRAAWPLGLVWGLGCFVPLLAWSGVYVGALPWLALAGLQASFVAIIAAVLPAALRAPGGAPLQAVAVAGVWVAGEAARARVPFGGFGWGRLAFSQSDSPLLPLAALAGAPGVSLALALLAALTALTVLAALAAARPQSGVGEGVARRAGGRPGSARRAAVVRAGALAGCAALLVGGAAAVPTPAVAEAGTLQVAAVQGNVPRPGLDFNAERRAVLDNHVRATRALADDVATGRAPAPDVVIWPENSSDIDPLRNADAYTEIDGAARAVGVPVLVGAVLSEPEGTLSNAVLAWEPGRGEVDRYVKQRPAPFAEYVPYRSFFRVFSDKVDLVRRDFAAGDRIGVLTPGGAPVGVAICFEVLLDDLVADTVDAGAQLLVVPTNNATFGFTDESVQQLAMSRLRAVEHGRAVVHISTVGVSELISPDGSVLATGGHFTREVLQAAMPLRTSRTLATRLGGWPEAAAAVAGLLLAAAGAGLLGRPRRPRRPGRGSGAPPGTTVDPTLPAPAAAAAGTGTGGGSDSR